eukprot:10212011-Lingulodinium_polyedra.AAC.1
MPDDLVALWNAGIIAPADQGEKVLADGTRIRKIRPVGCCEHAMKFAEAVQLLPLQHRTRLNMEPVQLGNTPDRR